MVAAQVDDNAVDASRVAGDVAEVGRPAAGQVGGLVGSDRAVVGRVDRGVVAVELGLIVEELACGDLGRRPIDPGVRACDAVVVEVQRSADVGQLLWAGARLRKRRLGVADQHRAIGRAVALPQFAVIAAVIAYEEHPAIHFGEVTGAVAGCGGIDIFDQKRAGLAAVGPPQFGAERRRWQ